jgi:hypothetical protein
MCLLVDYGRCQVADNYRLPVLDIAHFRHAYVYVTGCKHLLT